MNEATRKTLVANSDLLRETEECLWLAKIALKKIVAVDKEGRVSSPGFIARTTLEQIEMIQENL